MVKGNTVQKKRMLVPAAADGDRKSKQVVSAGMASTYLLQLMVTENTKKNSGEYREGKCLPAAADDDREY